MKLIDDLNNLDPEMKKRVFEVVKLITEGTASDDAPVWYDSEKRKINEVEFCEWFIQKHPLKFVGGLFYDIDGLVDEYKLKKEIVEVIKPYIETAIAKRASQILEGLKYEAYCEELPKHIDRVHFKNGTFFLEGGFVYDKEFCSNRLPVKYNPDAKKPTRWLQFLDELLYPEDIPTLQEFMGYTFIPTTKAQAMLMLIGSGGEGKSRIGFVCRNLLGDNMTVCSVTTLSNNRFALASQEGMLLMVDDDMKMEALSDTGIIKSVVIIFTENMMNFLDEKGITAFDELQSFLDEHGATYNTLLADLDNSNDKVNVLKAKISAWERYKGFLDVYKESQSFKGFAKMKFAKQHREVLNALPEEQERLFKTIPKGEKITPKAWQKEIYKILGEQFPIEDKMSAEVHDLAYAEVMKFNKTNEEREQANDQSAFERQLKRQQTRKHSYFDR